MLNICINWVCIYVQEHNIWRVNRTTQSIVSLWLSDWLWWNPERMFTVGWVSAPLQSKHAGGKETVDAFHSPVVWRRASARTSPNQPQYFIAQKSEFTYLSRSRPSEFSLISSLNINNCRTNRCNHLVVYKSGYESVFEETGLPKYCMCNTNLFQLANAFHCKTFL